MTKCSSRCCRGVVPARVSPEPEPVRLSFWHETVGFLIVGALMLAMGILL